MIRFLVLIGFVVVAVALWPTGPFSVTSASAEDSLLVQACKRARSHWELDKKPPKVETVQDFSNLKPPRVRMKVEGSFVNITFSCTFSSTTKPVGLQEYCENVLTTNCYKAGASTI
jgi:hypothetical protein